MMTLRYAVITVALALIVGALILALSGCGGNLGRLDARPNEHTRWYDWAEMRPL